MRVMVVILGHFATFNAAIYVMAVNVAGMTTARPDVQTTTMALSVSSSALIIARLPQSAARVAHKENVCTDVSTVLQVTTVTQVK